MTALTHAQTSPSVSGCRGIDGLTTGTGTQEPDLALDLALDPHRGPAQGRWSMDFGEAAQVARYDQVRAAQSDVVGILGVIARERQRWSRIDEGTHVRISALLEQFFAFEADPERVCPHARQAAFDRAPRPLVLDAVSGILACWEGCYWRVFSSEAARRRPDVACFSCERWLGEFVGGPDLFIAYGPILVVGALCEHCRDLAPSGSASASDRDT